MNRVIACSALAMVSVVGQSSACAVGSPASDGPTQGGSLDAGSPDAGAGADTGGSADVGAGNESSTGPESGQDAPPPQDSGSADAPFAADGGCPAPAPNTDTLPFAIDFTGKFIPSGYEGDWAAISMPNDPTCGGNRSSPNAKGNCHPVTYTPLVAGSGTTPQGWAGVLWQHPVNNWGMLPGYAIPAGASKVSFWARGASGGESLTFLVGGTGGGTNPCADTVSRSIPKMSLTTAWTHYTIPLQSQTYAGGVLAAFGFVLAAADQPATPDAGSPDGGPHSTSFFIDDIEWQ
jgi:hypothetical protein